ncbi:MAG: hypothetical protein AAB074_15665 [Planctomycetota bacterium]
MAYAKLFTNLSVVNGVSQYSQPFSMAGNNAFRFGVTVFSNSATSLTCTPQGSIDGQNWRDLTAATGLVVGWASFTQGSITDLMVRLVCTVVGTGTIVLAADVYTSQQ